jgi:hypothetical protein
MESEEESEDEEAEEEEAEEESEDEEAEDDKVDEEEADKVWEREVKASGAFFMAEGFEKEFQRSIGWPGFVPRWRVNPATPLTSAACAAAKAASVAQAAATRAKWAVSGYVRPLTIA